MFHVCHSRTTNLHVFAARSRLITADQIWSPAAHTEPRRGTSFLQLIYLSEFSLPLGRGIDSLPEWVQGHQAGPCRWSHHDRQAFSSSNFRSFASLVCCSLGAAEPGFVALTTTHFRYLCPVNSLSAAGFDARPLKVIIIQKKLKLRISFFALLLLANWATYLCDSPWKPSLWSIASSLVSCAPPNLSLRLSTFSATAGRRSTIAHCRTFTGSLLRPKVTPSIYFAFHSTQHHFQRHQ